MDRHWRSKKAFTLIELLVVVAILALLMAIVSPMLRHTKYLARLAVCGSNVKQILTGATNYAANSSGRLPASVVRWCWTQSGYSWANHLNYHADDPAADTKYNGGAMYPYLGTYLPDASVFVCPLSPGEPDYLQPDYEAANTKYLCSSYWLLWDYRGFATGFRGRTSLHSAGEDGLLVADGLAWRGYNNDWWQAHPSAGVSGTPDSLSTNFHAYTMWLRIAGSSAVPRGMTMNAGYVDGRVERYTSDELDVSKHVVPGYPHEFYIPAKVR